MHPRNTRPNAEDYDVLILFLLVSFRWLSEVRGRSVSHILHIRPEILIKWCKTVKLHTCSCSYIQLHVWHLKGFCLWVLTSNYFYDGNFFPRFHIRKVSPLNEFLCASSLDVLLKPFPQVPSQCELMAVQSLEKPCFSSSLHVKSLWELKLQPALCDTCWSPPRFILFIVFLKSLLNFRKTVWRDRRTSVTVWE